MTADELFDSIVRLRRAERRHPEDRDIVTARVTLEEQLGGTVSRTFAARRLGVSRPALDRWIAGGDIPTVLTPDLREEVPIAALIELLDAAQNARERGRRHVLEAALAPVRAAAEAMTTDVTTADDPHERALQRNLAIHRRLAPTLTREHVEEARRTLWRWQQLGRIDPRHADAWEAVLKRPLPEIQAIISEAGSGDALRQTSPFAGQLPEPERRRLLALV